MPNPLQRVTIAEISKKLPAASASGGAGKGFITWVCTQ